MEVTVGFSPDSIIDRYFSSSGAPSSSRIRSYIGKKRPERASHLEKNLRPFSDVKKAIVCSTASFSFSEIRNVSGFSGPVSATEEEGRLQVTGKSSIS